MKDTIYAWLDKLRETPPSSWPEGDMVYCYTKIGRFDVKRRGADLILYAPIEDKPSKYLVFATLSIDFSNEWIKPAYFDEKNYHGRADNWNQWWSYWFGKGE